MVRKKREKGKEEQGTHNGSFDRRRRSQIQRFQSRYYGRSSIAGESLRAVRNDLEAPQDPLVVPALGLQTIHIGHAGSFEALVRRRAAREP